jgi:hypothetical protein
MSVKRKNRSRWPFFLVHWTNRRCCHVLLLIALICYWLVCSLRCFLQSAHLISSSCVFGSFDTSRRSGLAIWLALVSPVILLGRLVLSIGVISIDQRGQYLQVFPSARARVGCQFNPLTGLLISGSIRRFEDIILGLKSRVITSRRGALKTVWETFLSPRHAAAS